jgi:hypothetical protein
VSLSIDQDYILAVIRLGVGDGAQEKDAHGYEACPAGHGLALLAARQRCMYSMPV